MVLIFHQIRKFFNILAVCNQNKVKMLSFLQRVFYQSFKVFQYNFLLKMSYCSLI